MTENGLRMTATPQGVVITVLVSAGSSRDAIVGIHGDALKVAVRQAPERGKANKQVVRLLAHALGLRHADIEVIKGHTSRAKRVLLRGLDERTLRANLVPFRSQ